MSSWVVDVGVIEGRWERVVMVESGCSWEVHGWWGRGGGSCRSLSLYSTFSCLDLCLGSQGQWKVKLVGFSFLQTF